MGTTVYMAGMRVDETLGKSLRESRAVEDQLEDTLRDTLTMKKKTLSR
jgi:hypothetical protein